MYDTGEHSVSDLAEVFSISRPTVYSTRRADRGRGVNRRSARHEDRQ